jgi:SPP1 gp7 family putative phage head morphogenesis protein
VADTPLRPNADPQWQALLAAADRDRGYLVRLFVAAFAGLRVTQEVRAAIRSGDLEAAMRALPLDRIMLLATALEPIYERIARRGVAVAAAARPRFAGNLVVRLGSNEGLRVEQIASWARAEAAALVVDVTEETRRAIRELIAQSIQVGRVPRETAKLLQDVVGLTRAQQRAVQRYADTLAAEGVLPALRDRLVTRYADRLLLERARTIARTESMRAANEGRRRQWQQDARDGLILRERWEREWLAIVPGDGRTCPICTDLDGQRAPIDGSYPNGMSGPPAHPRCRCTERLVRIAAVPA